MRNFLAVEYDSIVYFKQVRVQIVIIYAKKIMKYPSVADADPDPGSGAFRPLDLGSGMAKIRTLDSGSAINILNHIYKSLIIIIWDKNA